MKLIEGLKKVKSDSEANQMSNVYRDIKIWEREKKLRFFKKFFFDLVLENCNNIKCELCENRKGKGNEAIVVFIVDSC